MFRQDHPDESKIFADLEDPGGKEQRYVISVLKIIACIHEQHPRLEIQNLGETDIIVTYENQKTPPLLWHILKVVLVSAVIFFGSAFSIMAFNNDVGVTKLFGQIYELIMGKKTDGFSVLEVTYSIGLAIGILIFFRHVRYQAHIPKRQFFFCL